MIRRGRVPAGTAHTIGLLLPRALCGLEIPAAGRAERGGPFVGQTIERALLVNQFFVQAATAGRFVARGGSAIAEAATAHRAFVGCGCVERWCVERGRRGGGDRWRRVGPELRRRVAAGQRDGPCRSDDQRAASSAPCRMIVRVSRHA
jgi:hypothetical protein